MSTHEKSENCYVARVKSTFYFILHSDNWALNPLSYPFTVNVNSKIIVLSQFSFSRCFVIFSFFILNKHVMLR